MLFEISTWSKRRVTEDKAAGKSNVSPYPLILLVAVASVALLHRLSTGSLPPFDDTTYALVSKTILKTGDWITMRWLDIPYLLFGKPPLNFWFTALFFKLFGVGEFAARLSSAIHGVLGIVAVYYMGKELHSRFAGIAAGFFLLSLPDYFKLSQSAMLDVPVTFYITLSLLFYLLAEKTGRLLHYALFGVGFGLAIMTKSLVGLLPLIMIGLYHLLTKNLKPLFTARFVAGLGFGFLVCFPWHFWQYLRFGRSFFTQFFVDSFTYNAFTVLADLHHSSLGFYFGKLYENDPVHLALFAASLVLVAVMAIRGNHQSAFLIAQVLAVFILFSAFQTRMPWYITPAFPAMAICFGIFLERLYRIRRLSVAVIVAALILLGFQMRKRWTEDHWYLTGDLDLKQIVLDFKAKTTGGDVLYSYEIGEPVNTAPFYADRKAVNITTSKEAFENQIKIGIYVNAGYVIYVGSEDELDRWIKSGPGRYVLFSAGTYDHLRKRLADAGVSVLSSNNSYTIIKS
jgi:4-amino-4-deoxy-L-arabinose transferase-like glycosyltransferase